jgi:hypothetical protein
MSEMIGLCCWDCCAIYATPKDHPRCPNCGWKPERLVRVRDGTWADPAHVVVGVPYSQHDDGGEPTATEWERWIDEGTDSFRSLAQIKTDNPKQARRKAKERKVTWST